MLLGGMRATAWTDIFHGTWMLVSLITIFLIVLILGVGRGLPEAFTLVASTEEAMVSLPGPGSYWTYQMIFSWFVSYPIVFFCCMPHMFIWSYAAKSEKVILLVAVLWIPATAIAEFLLPFAGVFGRIVFPTLPPSTSPDTIVPAMVLELSPYYWMVPLLMTGAFAAAISTAAGVMICMSGMLTRDITLLLRPQTSEATLAWIGRAFVIVVSLVGIALAVRPPAIIAFMITASLVLVAPLVIPILVGLLWPRLNREGALSGLIVSLTIGSWLTFAPREWGGGFMAGPALLGFQPIVWALLASVVTTVVVTYLTPPPLKEVVERFFEKIPIVS